MNQYTRKELRHRSSSMNEVKRVIPLSKNEKYDLCRRHYRDAHHQEHLDACKRWHEKHTPSIVHYDPILSLLTLTERRKIFYRRHLTKRNRCLGFTVIYPNIIEEPIVWHHISNECVMAIPRDLHELYPGINVTFHRFMCNEIAKQLYIASFS